MQPNSIAATTLPPVTQTVQFPPHHVHCPITPPTLSVANCSHGLPRPAQACPHDRMTRTRARGAHSQGPGNPGQRVERPCQDLDGDEVDADVQVIDDCGSSVPCGSACRGSQASTPLSGPINLDVWDRWGPRWHPLRLPVGGMRWFTVRAWNTQPQPWRCTSVGVGNRKL